MDLIFVSYNSGKWIDKCFNSIMSTSTNLSDLSIYIVDNASSDETLEKLDSFKSQYGDLFATFDITKSKKNLGFGRANNLAASKGKSNIICFLNIDTELFEDSFINLNKEITSSDVDTAVWEFRQFPYEHPKLYDAISGETTWCSGAAFAVRREIYELVGGFDESIFMYAEDVDLSWRIRAEGYKLKYVPKVRITHYSYASASEIKPNQHVFGVINNLLLRYRFGTWNTIMLGHLLFWNLMRRPSAFKGAKRKLVAEYIKHFHLFFKFRKYKKHRDCKKFKPFFQGFDYSPIRDGAYYENVPVVEDILVSIVVRTCGRPAVLRETLISLRNQTYKNIEIVIVEDGENLSEDMIYREFNDLNVLYFPTGEKVGRSKAGNIAIEKAHGKYINFLDDDDLFYADHVEILIGNLKGSTLKAAYALAFETPIKIESKDPYLYKIMDYRGVHKQKYNKIMLCHHNYIPIQCIMFEKNLFEQYGGLDESVDALEDWDLWVRYSQCTDFLFIYKTTSIYRVPYDYKVNSKRQKELDDALVVMRDKHKTYSQQVSVYDLSVMYQKMIE